MSECTHHLTYCFDILRRERDPSRWPVLIEAIPDEAREACRAWLHEHARRQQLERLHGMSPPKRRPH